MMKKWNSRSRLYRIALPAGGLLALGGCGLSDQQLTGILTSVVTSGLTTLMNTFLVGLAATGGA